MRTDAAALGALRGGPAVGGQQRLRRVRASTSGAFQRVAHAARLDARAVLRGRVAFVGTSRVLPRFRQYAPGLTWTARSAACTPSTRESGRVLGSLTLAGRQPDLRASMGAPSRGRGASVTIGATAPPLSLFYAYRPPGVRYRSRRHEEIEGQQKTRNVFFAVFAGFTASRIKARHERLRLLMIGDVRERRQHHPPLSRRPSRAVRLSVRVAARDARSSHDALTSMFPVKYRWPVFALARDAGAGLPRDHRRGVQGPRAHAAREQVPRTRRSTCPTTSARRTTCRASRRRAARAATTWPRSSAPRSTPGRTIDAARARERLRRLQPDHRRRRGPDLCATCRQAHVLHVVRNPWSAYADTKKRPVPLSLAHYMTAWDRASTTRSSAASSTRPRSTSSAPRTSWPTPRRRSAASVAKLGLESAPIARDRAGTAAALQEVYPWGTIRRATPEANVATARELRRPSARRSAPAPAITSTPSTTRRCAAARMNRVVVTGGTGFVGANLVRRLIADGHEVHLLVRPEFSSWRIESIRDEWRSTRSP